MTEQSFDYLAKESYNICSMCVYVFVCETRDIGAGGPSIAPLPFSSGCFGATAQASTGAEEAVSEPEPHSTRHLSQLGGVTSVGILPPVSKMICHKDSEVM